jgi:hypothetical protein
MDGPGIDVGPPRLEAGDWLPESWHSQIPKKVRDFGTLPHD